ncbi:MAG: hypothetical protein IPJ19_00365 [Planctomycetes bacterium]|nr:hypothetical protein [Planctomycetota bacterium]
MRRSLARLAGAVYVLAWFVPVLKDGSTLSDGVLPGWEALRAAFSPIWPGDFGGTQLQGALCVGTGLTNLVFLVAFTRLVRREAPRTRLWSWSLFVAAALDTFWIFAEGAPPGLSVGYYLWLGSFVLLGVAAWRARAS